MSPHLANVPGGIGKAQRETGQPCPSSAFEGFHEALCVQIVHVGPYAEEPRTIAKMQAFAVEQGYTLPGKHH
jgi:hypothetical protein